MHGQGTVAAPAGNRCEYKPRLFAQRARTFLLHGIECGGCMRARRSARALIPDGLNRLDHAERSFVRGAHAIPRSLLSLGSETKTKERGQKKEPAGAGFVFENVVTEYSSGIGLRKGSPEDSLKSVQEARNRSGTLRKRRSTA
jgi:hypothetical protein